MKRLLFVSNGHGESAIAERIARDVRALAREPLGLDHLPLVGLGTPATDDAALTVVGPRRTLPSGGLVAMGNVRALASDLRAGFAGLLAAQLRFLRASAGQYAAAIAVGDVYALGLTLTARAPVVFVGTAKSVHVAPYGPFERTVLRRARRIFVRDAPTADALRANGVPAEAPGNVMVDLLAPDGVEPPASERGWIGILPGSRERAYVDAVRLARVVRELARRHGAVDALVSIAPTVDPTRLAAQLEADGWTLASAEGTFAFEATSGDCRLAGWRGAVGALLRASRIVLGQAGTANEQAAATGVPVVALDRAPGEAALAGGEGWYRMRQRRLLGDALEIAPADPAGAAELVAGILADGARRGAMAAEGRRRMGGPGGSAAIARAVVDLFEAAAGERTTVPVASG